jgi:hypothetical protein
MAAVELNLKPDTKLLRQFGFIALVGFGILAVLAWNESLAFSYGLGEHRQTLSFALAGVGLASALLSAIAPRANLALYLVLTLLTYPVGFVLSYVIMGLLFFGLFAPIGLAMRLFGRDALALSRRCQSESYWQDSGPERSMGDYFRQF